MTRLVLAALAAWALAILAAGVGFAVWASAAWITSRRRRRRIARDAAAFLAGAWEAREDREGQ